MGKNKKNRTSNRYRLSEGEITRLEATRKQAEQSRVLIIGDTHCPFDLDTYLDFLVDTYNKYNCNRVVHIGDELDNHFSSYHETDANAMGGGDELAFAKKRLARYYKQFPDVDVIIGNHSRLIMRKAQSGGVPKEWMREYNDVLGVPNWDFHTELEIDGVLYAHGEGGTARGKCKADLQSVVQGHLHTQLYVDYVVGRNNRVFGMQVGCGIDHEAYAFGYAKAGKKPAIGCGVVIGGKEAIAVPMLMEDYKQTKFKTI
jgi:metallophosphoesterase superfamily enzyme|tara:strand:- start:662 stop:1435 length:774 start_codon:yes stop_codon:yes gene_type:complete